MSQFQDLSVNKLNVIDISKLSQFSELSSDHFGKCLRFNFKSLFSKGLRTNPEITFWTIPQFNLDLLVSEIRLFQTYFDVDPMNLSLVSLKSNTSWIMPSDSCNSLCSVSNGSKSGNITCFMYCKIVLIKYWMKSNKFSHLEQLKDSLNDLDSTSESTSPELVDKPVEPKQMKTNKSAKPLMSSSQLADQPAKLKKAKVDRGQIKSPRSVHKQLQFVTMRNSSIELSKGFKVQLKRIVFDTSLELEEYPTIWCGSLDLIAKTNLCVTRLNLCNIKSFINSWIGLDKFILMGDDESDLLNCFLSGEQISCEEFEDIGIIMTDYEFPKGTVMTFFSNMLMIGGTQHSSSVLTMFFPLTLKQLNKLIDSNAFLGVEQHSLIVPFLKFSMLNRVLSELVSIGEEMFIINEQGSI